MPGVIACHGESHPRQDTEILTPPPSPPTTHDMNHGRPTVRGEENIQDRCCRLLVHKDTNTDTDTDTDTWVHITSIICVHHTTSSWKSKDVIAAKNL